MNDAIVQDNQSRTALLDEAEQMFEGISTGDVSISIRPPQRTTPSSWPARTLQGGPISTEDAQIAAMALVAGLTIATRNIKDFEAVEDLLLAGPWKV